jgi:hypothetical protein
MYERDFFLARKKTTAKVLKQNQNALRTLCDWLDEKPIQELGDADFKRIEGMIAGDKRKKLRLLEGFFDYCGEAGIYRGANPVTVFFDRNKSKRAAGKGPYRARSTHLDLESEKRLHDLIADNLESDLALAIPLVKGFRMTMARVLEITWKDIEIDDHVVLIHDHKENLTGGTHNYTAPPTKETADFLSQKHALLAQKFKTRQLVKMPVVPVEGGKKEKIAILTKHFRQMLRDAGVSADEISRAADPHNPKAAGGGGYSLLCSHYDYVLQERCGVDLDSGVGCYLRGLRIHDTTSDYYRSLSDGTGAHYLQMIMNRDDIWSAAEGPKRITSREEGASKVIMVPSGPPGTRTRVNSNKRIFLPAGSTLMVRSPTGVEGNVWCFKTEDGQIELNQNVELY